MNIYKVETYEAHLAYLKYFDSKDGKMAYLDVGEGEVFVLIHGIPTSSWLYRKMISQLVQKGKRVIVPDMLGFGASDKPNDVDVYSHKEHGARLKTLLEHLNIKEWTHVMHDAGGLWTNEMILQRIRGIKTLILLNTILFKEGFKPPMKFGRNAIGLNYAKTYCSPILGKPMVKATMKNGIYKDKISKKALKGYWKPLQKDSHNALFNFFSSFDEIEEKLPSYQKAISDLKIPVKIIWGKKDKILIGKKQIPLIKEKFGVKDEAVLILEKAGHFIQEEEPERIVNFILK